MTILASKCYLVRKSEGVSEAFHRVSKGSKEGSEMCQRCFKGFQKHSGTSGAFMWVPSVFMGIKVRSMRFQRISDGFRGVLGVFQEVSEGSLGL